MKEPWEESDKDGTVIFATVQTVSCPRFCFLLCLVALRLLQCIFSCFICYLLPRPSALPLPHPFTTPTPVPTPQSMETPRTRSWRRPTTRGCSCPVTETRCTEMSSCLNCKKVVVYFQHGERRGCMVCSIRGDILNQFATFHSFWCELALLSQ